MIDDLYSNHIFDHFDNILKNKKKDKFLVSVSGGSDSVLLLFLFVKYFEKDNDRIIIVHVNHHLRDDSDVDENFVSILGKELSIETHIGHLDPNTISKGQSVEAWAREGRYDYLKNILFSTKANWIVTAHHANDQAETILMNISKKTGLFGLGGIKEVNNNIIRPLLPFSKSYLMNIIKQYSIPHMIDSTNSDNSHYRNFLRNNIIKNWEEIETSLIDGIKMTANNFQDWQESMIFFVNCFIEKNSCTNVDGSTAIDKKELKKLPVSARVCVFQILTNSIGILRKSDYRNIKLFFIRDSIGDIYHAKNNYVILNDRKQIIIKKKKSIKTNELELMFGKNYTFDGYEYSLKNYIKKISFSDDSNDELVDFDFLKNKKLVLRYWKPGDRFKPLGMNGTQKISDLLINGKVNMFEKEHQTVITADDQIIWVCGHRIDRAVRINNNTKNITRITRVLNKVI